MTYIRVVAETWDIIIKETSAGARQTRGGGRNGDGVGGN